MFENWQKQMYIYCTLAFPFSALISKKVLGLKLLVICGLSVCPAFPGMGYFSGSDMHVTSTGDFNSLNYKLL